jgi:alanine dehydrogenase
MPVQQLTTLVLTRSDVESSLGLDDYIAAVERGFRCHTERSTFPGGMLHVDAPRGEFHIKAGGIKDDQPYFSLKVNGCFFENSSLFGIPNIHGILVLCDAWSGYPVAVMDSGELTRRRTGAATAIAAKYLARADSSTATICGCGVQGELQLEFIAHVLPIKLAYVFNRNQDRRIAFAKRMSEKLGIEVQPVGDLRTAVLGSDVCVTCTPVKKPLLQAGDVPRGCFVAAVGADGPDRQELDERLLVSSKLVVDMVEQCATVGEFHHAIKAGLLKIEDVHAELGEIVAGFKDGRTSDEEIIVYDSTGTAFQDVAAATAVYEHAVHAKKGTRMALCGNQHSS